MSTTITVRDEELSGKTLHEFSLELLTETITVRELIRSRVYQEVSEYNHKSNRELFQGLVQPRESERMLNGPKAQCQIDWRKQFHHAVEAFERKQILVLIDDRQMESLDEEIEIKPETAVSFIRLVLLVGG